MDGPSVKEIIKALVLVVIIQHEVVEGLAVAAHSHQPNGMRVALLIELRVVEELPLLILIEIQLF